MNLSSAVKDIVLDCIERPPRDRWLVDVAAAKLPTEKTGDCNDNRRKGNIGCDNESTR